MIAQVVKLRDFSIDQMIDEIHKNFAAEREAGNRADRARIRAGQLLLTMRERIEAGEAGKNVGWWDWYKDNIVRSRRDAEKVMALARNADPEEAAAIERASNREAVAKTRAKSTAAYSKTDSNADQDDEDDPVEVVLGLIGEMTTRQRQRLFAALRSKYENSH
jgi:hypothetical protein